MGKTNCWEFKKCGRELGGARVDELGVCVASTDSKMHKIHGGRNAGRACWISTGTLCKGKVQASFTMKVLNCMDCEFFSLIKKEEGKNYTPASLLFGHFTKQ